MPSIVSKKESLHHTYATAPSNKVSKSNLGGSSQHRNEGDFGIVNYINGVPVSI